MNIDKYIFVVGPTEQQLNSAIQELTDLYANTGYTEGIFLYKSLTANNQYVINFSNVPDFERFKYFVNYLHYPQVADYHAKVMGFWTIGQLDKTIKQLIGKRVLLYVSDEDNEKDNVFAIYSGAISTIKFGFAMGEEYEEIDTLEFDYAEPKLNNENFQQVATISPDPNAKKKSTDGCVPILIFIGLIIAGLYLLI